MVVFFTRLLLFTTLSQVKSRLFTLDTHAKKKASVFAHTQRESKSLSLSLFLSLSLSLSLSHTHTHTSSSERRSWQCWTRFSKPQKLHYFTCGFFLVSNDRPTTIFDEIDSSRSTSLQHKYCVSQANSTNLLPPCIYVLFFL